MSHRQLAWIVALGLTLAGFGRADLVIDLDFGGSYYGRGIRAPKPPEFVDALAYSPDGKTLVSAGKGGFFFWDTATGKRLAGLPAEANHGTGVVFAPDGTSLYTGDSAGNLVRWDVAARQIAFRFPHVHGAIKRIHLSRDGGTLVSSDGRDSAFWDAPTGRFRHVWKTTQPRLHYYGYIGSEAQAYVNPGHHQQVLSPDGKWCAHLRDHKYFQVRATKSDQQKQRWPDAAVSSIDIAPDGKSYAVASKNGGVQVVDAESLQPIRSFATPCADCLVQFSPDGRFVIAHQPDVGILAAFEVATGRTLWQHRQAPVWRSTALAFAPDGKHLATGDSDRRIRVYDLVTGKLLRVIDFPPDAPAQAPSLSPPAGLPAHARMRLGEPHLWHPALLGAGCFMNQGKQILLVPSAGEKRAPLLYDTVTGKLVRRFDELEYTVPDNALAPPVLTPDRRHLLLASGNDLIWWDLDKRRVAHRYTFPSQITALALARDGKRIAVACFAEPECPQPIHVWDLESGALQSMQGQDVQISMLAFSPDGKRLFSCNTKHSQGRYHRSQEFAGRILEWDLATGKILRERLHDAGLMAVSPDGNLWALRDQAYKCELFDWRQQRTIATIEYGERFVFAPDGLTLAVGGQSTMARFYDARTGKVIRVCEGHLENGVSPLCFSDDGKTLATMELSDGNVRLWNVAEGAEVCRNPFHRGPIQCIAYSPDGKLIVTAGNDRRLLAWDAKTGRLLGEASGVHEPEAESLDPKTRKPLASQRGHELPILHLMFSGDGRFLLSACRQRILIWDVASRKIILNHHPNSKSESTPRAIALDGTVRELHYVDADGTAQTWDIATGKLKTSFKVITNKQRGLTTAAYSKDGAYLAVQEFGTHELVVWDIARQKRFRSLTVGPPLDPERPYMVYSCTTLMFSPDNRYVAACISESSDHFAAKRMFRSSVAIGVWELAGGEKVVSIDNTGGRALAFSPDGSKLLHGVSGRWSYPYGYDFYIHASGADTAVVRDLSAGGEFVHYTGSGTGRVCETSGWELLNVVGKLNSPAQWAFSPDGRSLASVDVNRTVVVHDAEALAPRRSERAPADLDQAWRTLGMSESTKAHAAIWQLTRDPDRALAFLKARLKAPAVPTEPRLRELFHALDSDHFTQRAAAQCELERYGELIEPLLRAELARTDKPDRRRRLEGLLARLDDDLFAERLQQARGLEAVEKLGHPDAVRVLEDLSRGPADARLTRAARAALARLKSQGRTVANTQNPFSSSVGH